MWCETFNEQGGPMHVLCKGAGRHGTARGCPSKREEHYIVPMNPQRQNERGELMVREVFSALSQTSHRIVSPPYDILVLIEG